MTALARLAVRLRELLRTERTRRGGCRYPPRVVAADAAADVTSARAATELHPPDRPSNSRDADSSSRGRLDDTPIPGPLPVLTTASLAASLGTGPLALAGVSAAGRELIRVRLIAASLAAVTWHDPEDVILGDVLDTPEKQLAWDLLVHDALNADQRTGRTPQA
jgi:hypothetical protein